MQQILLFAGFFISLCGFGQITFQSAYQNHPNVPSGVLEAVAWTNTRMQHLENQMESCSGYPKAYGVMGLHDDGKGYFIENGQKVAALSGISVSQQKSDPILQIEAYATALESLLPQTSGNLDPVALKNALFQLSEIPDSGLVNLLAREMQVYEVLRFMSDPNHGQTFGFAPHHINLESVFGTEHYAVLSAETITLSSTGITNENGQSFTLNSNASVQYAPAIWNPAPSCNFSSRNGVAISAITIHTIQGTYAGAISWSQNCVSNVSFHYVLRSSDGQVTQMLLEEDKGWHVGSENPYTIGYEHEGYVSDPIWYTETMYNSSADLSRDIINSGYGIPGLRTYFGASSATIDVLGGCTKIKGHQHYPNQTHTDPGIHWDWEKYYRLINDGWTPTTITSTSGTITDSGGPTGNYSDDERQFWLIQPSNSASIELDFAMFNIEDNWDYLFIYDGDSINDPLIGQFTGTTVIPTITSSGGSLLLEFRSDCATTAPGWEATFVSTPQDMIPPVTQIMAGSVWQTDDFTVDFSDTDMQSAIVSRYYLVAEKEITENAPKSDGLQGFVNEAFEDGTAQWTDVTGNFVQTAGTFEFNDVSEQNSNTYLTANQSAGQSYLYSWTQTIIGTGPNQRAGMHFFCDDAALSNRGNSYFVYLRTSDLVQIYSVDNNIFNLEADIPFTIDPDTAYEVKVEYDPATGWIRVYIDNSFVGEWQDITPLTNGNAISLRSGGCNVQFDEVRMYQSRGNQAVISAGIGDLMSIESEGAVPTGFVYALSKDALNNWSQVAEEPILLDFTKPEIVYLNDGNAADIDTVFSSTLESNWQAIDIHSSIGNYEVAIGTLPTLNNIVDWTPNGLQEAFSYVISNPVFDEVYHISIRAINGAGLHDTFISDGQRYVGELNLESINLQSLILYPNPANNEVRIKNLQSSIDVLIYDAHGKLCLEKKLSRQEPLNIQSLNAGNYRVMLKSGSSVLIKQMTVIR